MRKGEERQLLDDLADLTNLSSWETDFVYSLIDQLDSGNTLTEKTISQTNRNPRKASFGLLIQHLTRYKPPLSRILEPPY